MLWPDGKKYEGTFFTGYYHGSDPDQPGDGTLTIPPEEADGPTVVYKGTFQNGMKDGNGIETTTYPNGNYTTYKGDFKNDKADGEGVEFGTEEDGWIGKWVAGERGEGKPSPKLEEKLTKMGIALRKAMQAKLDAEGIKLKVILKTLSDTTKIGQTKTWKSTRPFAMKKDFENASWFTKLTELEQIVARACVQAQKDQNNMKPLQNSNKTQIQKLCGIKFAERFAQAQEMKDETTVKAMKQEISKKMALDIKGADKKATR